MFFHKMSRFKPFHQYNLQFLFIFHSPKGQITRNFKSNLQNFKEHIKNILHKKPSNQYVKNNRPKLTVLSLLWTRQCECIIAHRIRRGQQMFTLYSKLWSESAIKAMLRRVKHQLTRRSVLFGATAGLTLFDWNENKIQDDKLLEHVSELEQVRNLCQDQITCPECNNRILIDCKMGNVTYCNCVGQPHSVKEKFNAQNPIPKGEWQPFIERKDMLVWRKECEQGKYAYKMYGSYNNISANDYLDVQINVAYRKKWDDSVMDLRVIENDPDSHSEIVYWEMKWPRFFSNRDYVFNRRYYIDEKNKIIVLVCQSTTHPSCPIKKNAIRVNEYWSILVIRAHTELNRPGIEFSLTYFDDPGVVLPETMKSWIAVTGMPDFMKRMHLAAKSYKKCLVNNEDECKYTLTEKSTENIPKTEVPSAEDDDSFIYCERMTRGHDEAVTEGTVEDEKCVEYVDRLDDISVGFVSPTTTDNSYWSNGNW